MFRKFELFSFLRNGKLIERSYYLNKLKAVKDIKVFTKCRRKAPCFSNGDIRRQLFSKSYLSQIALDRFKWYNVYMKYKSNHNVVYSCKYHVVWCPKYRRSVLINGVDIRLKELIKETCNQLNVEIIEMEIMPDHVHLIMEVDPQFGVHKAVKQIKGYSSKVLRTEFPWLKSRLPSLWTNSYFVSTVGGAPSAVIKQYIENQKNV